MLKIQSIYPLHFSNYRIRFTQLIVEDIANKDHQNRIIIEQHNRAHRNEKENRIQILEKYYFPGMAKQIKAITKLCRTCKENKYDRHPNNPKLEATPLPNYPGQTIHIDIFSTDKQKVLTSIDKFSKLVAIRKIEGKSIECIKNPLRELIFYYGVPKNIVFDNEKSFNSHSIKFMLENEFKINIFTAPPYTSEVNGQIERVHSTLAEIMRFLKQEHAGKNFDELLELYVNEYNHSIHSFTGKKPVDLFFSRPTKTLEEIRNETIEKLKAKQQKDLEFHN